MSTSEGHIRKDKIRNCKWTGHVKHWDIRKVQDIQLPEKRKRGRQERRYLDVVKENLQEVGAKETGLFDQSV